MKKKIQKISNESSEFKKYWKLDDYRKIPKKWVDNLIKLYYQFKDAHNKCAAAILLSHIDDDHRVPPILFDALKYWNDSGYAGWVMTTNARLFNYYPRHREKFLDLVFNGKSYERDILINSLFFFQVPLREITSEEIHKILKRFIAKEPIKKLKSVVLYKMNITKIFKFVERLLVKYDPLGLIKEGGDKRIYQIVALDIPAYLFRLKRKEAIKRIKRSFDIHFDKIPNDFIINKIIKQLLDKKFW